MIILGTLATIAIGITGIVMTINKTNQQNEQIQPTVPEKEQLLEGSETLQLLKTEDINQFNGIVTKEDDDRTEEQIIDEFNKTNSWKEAVNDVFLQHQNDFQDATTYDFRNLDGFSNKCTREEVLHARSIYDINLRDCGWIFTKKE